MLLRRVEDHLKRFRMPPSRFGREAMGDPKFVFQLREGRTPRPQTALRVDRYLDAHGAPADGAECSR
jgi:hypothetical protein